PPPPSPLFPYTTLFRSRRHARPHLSAHTASGVAASDIEVGDVQRVVLDELAARLDDVAHQAGEDLVGHVGILDLDLQQGAVLGIDRKSTRLNSSHVKIS